MKVLVPYLPFTKSASLATYSQASFFLFLSLKYLFCLSFNTDNFLTASHNFWSSSVVIFALYPLLFSRVLLYEGKLLKKLSCSPCVSRSHYKNDAASVKQSQLLPQEWSKISASLRQCCFTLTSHSAQDWRRRNAEVAQTQVSVNQA